MPYRYFLTFVILYTNQLNECPYQVYHYNNTKIIIISNKSMQITKRGSLKSIKESSQYVQYAEYNQEQVVMEEGIIQIQKTGVCVRDIIQIRMQKQKKTYNSQQLPHKQRAKPPKPRPTWTQQHFKQLYPYPPQIHTSPTFFTTSLHYMGNTIPIKLPTGISTSTLPYIFHKQIYKFLLSVHDTNPLLKIAHVVGFQSVNADLLLDYQIAIGVGVLESRTAFNCVMWRGEGRLGRYRVFRCLAIGGFSKVYLVRSLRDGQFYAMKVMLKKFIETTQKQSIIQNQKNISSQLNHPFIVRLNHAFQTTNFVCLVLDCKILPKSDCPGGQLFYYLKKVKRMSQQHARFYFIEILYGLLYLHQNKIIYRDLKPENLLINYDGHIKIADFGLSKQNMKDKDLTYSFCGSTEYMPPQMILREGHSFGVDFYTLGALLYELVTGLPPFYSKDEQQIKHSIINQQLTFPESVPLTPQIKNLLSALLHKNQKYRIGSMRGLKQILFHPWIGKVNSQAILEKQLEPPYIPPIDEFNFDENELGEDEEQFTRALLSQHLCQGREVLTLKDFQFVNERPLRSQVVSIFQKYGNDRNSRIQNQKLREILDIDRKRQIPKKCHSMKNLKTRNKSQDFDKPTNLKKQASSPYLHSRNTNFTTSKRKIKTILDSHTPEKSYKSPSSMPKSKNTLSRSLSKKGFKPNLKNTLNIAKEGHPTVYSKALKKHSTNSRAKENCSDPELIPIGKQNGGNLRRGQGYGNSGNNFLKKKTLAYNYVHN